MHAIVLVGGFGTRLRPLTLTRPKQMLPVLDRPMLEWVVEHLVGHGIEDVVLSLGYLPDAFVAAYPSGRCAGARLHYAVEPEPLDTAGAIGFAARHVGLVERFVVVNGDVVTDVDIAALVALHERRGAEGTIQLAEVEDPSRYGVVPIDESGRVVAFVEKPSIEDAPTRWVNAGTYVLEPSVLDHIPEGRRTSIERETFPMLVGRGSLYALQHHGYWVDAGTPQSYLRAQVELAARWGCDDGAGGYCHEGARIAPGAKVARSVVMDGASVGEAAEVVGSVLLPGAQVAAGARVVDSIVGEGAVVGGGAQLVAGSIIGDGVVVGPGAYEGVRLPGPDLWPGDRP